MHKEMIYRFFLLQTHTASTSTAKISSLKHVFHKNLAFWGRPSKKQTFYCVNGGVVLKQGVYRYDARLKYAV